MDSTPALNTRAQNQRRLLEAERSSESTVDVDDNEDSYTELEDSQVTMLPSPEISPRDKLSPLSTIVSIAKYNAGLEGRAILEETFPHVVGATPKLNHPEIITKEAFYFAVRCLGSDFVLVLQDLCDCGTRDVKTLGYVNLLTPTGHGVNDLLFLFNREANISEAWQHVATDGAVYKRENTAASPPSDQISIDLASPIKLDSPKSNLNALMGLSSVKKGFTNFSKMIDSALKPVPDDAISDSISIRSDGSSDSDNSVMIKLSQADDMFNVDGNDALSEGVDIGSEAFEEDNNSGTTMSVTTASESHSNASSYKRRDLISVATFKLGQVELVQQSQGLESVIKAQVSNIAIEDCSAIPWDEFQSKFSTRSRGWTEVCEQPADRPRIRLRKEHSVTTGDLKSSNLKISSWFNDILTVSLSNINLAMNMSTMTSIAEFSVDDITTPSLPVEIHLENLEFTIVDDRPMLQGGGNPSNIHISKLCVHRNKDGIIKIEPPVSIPVSTPVSQEVTTLKTENEQLRRRLIAMERLNEENHRLRKSEEEIQLLRTCLSEAQESVNSLLLEKQSLLDIIKNSQQSKGDGRQQSSGKR